MWEIEGTDEFATWYDGLSDDQSDAVDAAVEALEIGGPGLGRPFVDQISRSRHQNMKELRPRGGHLRILFVFDPRRHAILLIGGDKMGRWNEWYEQAIPRADALYDEYLTELRARGVIS